MESTEKTNLLRLADEKSTAGRAALAERIEDLLGHGSAPLTACDRLLTFNVLHAALPELDTMRRAKLAEVVADLADAPRPLIRILANDAIDIAAPVLMASAQLHDDDLIEIVKYRGKEHQLAVANRRRLSADVSQTLVDTGDADVIGGLLANADASISPATMAAIVDLSEQTVRLQEPLLQRRELDPVLAKRLYLWVSPVLRQHILDRYDLEQDELGDLLEAAVLREIDRHEAEPATSVSSDDLAKALTDGTGNTPDLLVQILRAGELSLFLSQVAERTGLPPAFVSRVIFAQDGIGLAIVCKALNFGTAYFASLFALSRNSHSANPGASRKTVRKVMEFYQQTPRAAAASVLRRWRHDPRYQAAIRELEMVLKASA